MKKFLVPTFILASIMYVACGDDSSNSADDRDNGGEESSSSHDSISLDNNFEEFHCYAATDTNIWLGFRYDYTDSVMVRSVYPSIKDGVDKACEKAKAEKTADQTVTCDSIVTIVYPKEHVSDSTMLSLMNEECNPD